MKFSVVDQFSVNYTTVVELNLSAIFQPPQESSSSPFNPYENNVFFNVAIAMAVIAGCAIVAIVVLAVLLAKRRKTNTAPTPTTALLQPYTPDTSDQFLSGKWRSTAVFDQQNQLKIP